MSESSSIYKKWAQLISEVSYIQKTGYNQYHKYSYVTEEALLDALRPKMAELGLVFYPHAVELLESKGSVLTVHYTYRLVDVDTGEYVDLEVISQGADSADKAAFKAATGARKYALRQLVLVSTGDDPEKDDDSLDGIVKNSNAVVVARKLREVGLEHDDKRLTDAIGMKLVDVPGTPEGTALLKKVYQAALNIQNGMGVEKALGGIRDE